VFSNSDPAPPELEYTRQPMTGAPFVGTAGWVMVNAPEPAEMATVASAEICDSPCAVIQVMAQRAVDIAREPAPAL